MLDVWCLRRCQGITTGFVSAALIADVSQRFFEFLSCCISLFGLL